MQANLEDLVQCPYCDWAAEIAVSADVDCLFHCRSHFCGVISCRKCRKRNHFPKTCDQAQEDATLGARHSIEEAMTEALLRTCPACGKKSYKTEGCNRMKCVCGRTMCYVCKASPIDYSHFNQTRQGSAHACILASGHIVRRHRGHARRGGGKMRAQHRGNCPVRMNEFRSSKTCIWCLDTCQLATTRHNDASV
jgi:hypothetical protein